MKRITASKMMVRKYKRPTYANTSRGWERVSHVTPWGCNVWVHIPTHKHGGFCVSHNYILYRPTAKQIKHIEAV